MQRHLVRQLPPVWHGMIKQQQPLFRKLNHCIFPAGTISCGRSRTQTPSTQVGWAAVCLQQGSCSTDPCQACDSSSWFLVV